MEVGSGFGTMANFILASNACKSYFGVELNELRFEMAKNTLPEMQAQNFLNDDAFNILWDRFDVVIANPPMLPGETGFIVSGDLFWERLIKKIKDEKFSGVVYLHLFNFYLDCFLNERALVLADECRNQELDFRILAGWKRELSSTSAISKWLKRQKSKLQGSQRHTTPSSSCYNVRALVARIQKID